MGAVKLDEEKKGVKRRSEEEGKRKEMDGEKGSLPVCACACMHNIEEKR